MPHIHTPFSFLSSVFCKAKHGSRCEDAFFTSPSLLIVADGVGGWALRGIDPSKYSHSLVKNYVKCIEQGGDDITVFRNACNMNKHIEGSSTFCVCRFEREKMRTLNMGDSGYMLIRKGRLLYRSMHQQHAFNFPYQVGKNGDDVSKADVAVHEDIEYGDKVVVATDGLWDNVYEKDVVDMVANGLDANAIGGICYRLSKHRGYVSPFCVGSGYRYVGGKEDDITIIVSTIVKHNKL